MKMIMTVLMIRFIVSLFEKAKNKEITLTDTECMQHPAEFRIR